MSKRSAYTSINQIPGVFKNQLLDYYKNFSAVKKCVMRNFDVGGGKYDTGTKFLASKDIENIIYDPYNRSKEFNTENIHRAMTEIITSITCLNVLNVIRNKRTRLHLLMFIRKISHNNINGYAIPFIFFSIYEKRGDGKADTDLTQNNMKAAEYIPEIEKIFYDKLVIRHKNVITVSYCI